MTSYQTIYPEETYVVPVPVAVVIDLPWPQLSDELRLLLNNILKSCWSVHSIRPGIAASHRRCIDIDRKPRFLIAFLPPAKGIPVYEAVEVDGL